MKKVAATLLGPPLRNLLAGADLAIHFWDGSRLEGDAASSPALALRSPRALRRLVFSPNEHVGTAQLEHYFWTISSLLAPGGRILNHAISATEDTPGGDGPSFISRYVFPDGELHEVGAVVTALHRARLEVRDVESLREHYPPTLRAWVDNLQSNWDEAQSSAGAGRARVWRMYAAASALVFEAGRIGVYQTLAVKPESSGRSGLPMTRESFVSRVDRI